MKIVVIGGTGLIGTQLCENLRRAGHEVLAASPNSGVNAVTGEGLRDALDGAQVVVDVSNSPSFEDQAVMEFFTKSGRNLLAAERTAGIAHHVVLSLVGTERMLDSGYFRAKMVQEKLIKESGVPYSILRATQFFEFMGGIAFSGGEGRQVRLTTAALQPVASADVAQALATIAVRAPSQSTEEVAGPDRRPLSEFVRDYLEYKRDSREVIDDPEALYFGAPVNDRSLTPGDRPIIGRIRFEDWLLQQV